MKLEQTMDTHTSQLLEGIVMHQRRSPILHRFIYPLFVLRFNLSEYKRQGTSLSPLLFGINRKRPVSLHFKDHGARTGDDLETWARTLLAQASNMNANNAEKNANAIDGDIVLQAFPRVFGFVFNPISLWYCHRQDGALMAIIAEVNNTFGEHHCYVLEDGQGNCISPASTLSCKKQMHVSPFCEVKGHYQFQFKEHAQRSLIRIDYHLNQSALINTTLATQKHALNNANLMRLLFKYPFLSLGVVLRIHTQALRLWLKRVPFFSKPKLAPLPYSNSNSHLHSNSQVSEEI
jgi:DUF1365 family protein